MANLDKLHIGIALLITLAMACAADIARADGDPAKYLSAAQAGNVEAQVRLANEYLGMGQLDLTIEWLKKASDQGNTTASWFVAHLYADATVEGGLAPGIGNRPPLNPDLAEKYLNRFISQTNGKRDEDDEQEVRNITALIKLDRTILRGCTRANTCSAAFGGSSGSDQTDQSNAVPQMPQVNIPNQATATAIAAAKPKVTQQAATKLPPQQLALAQTQKQNQSQMSSSLPKHFDQIANQCVQLLEADPYHSGTRQNSLRNNCNRTVWVAYCGLDAHSGAYTAGIGVCGRQVGGFMLNPGQVAGLTQENVRTTYYWVACFDPYEPVGVTFTGSGIKAGRCAIPGN